MTKSKSLYHGHRFPAAIISCAVHWYFRFQLSLRDIEELLLERGVAVTYETVRRWCGKFGAAFARRVKAARRKPGGTWHLDEMYVTLRGEPWLLWRAVDQHGAELDILLQKRRDKAAAKRFFKRVLRSNPAPRKIVTDQLRSYPAAKAEIPELAQVKHVFVKAAARLNNRAENSHQPTRERDDGSVPFVLRADPPALRLTQTQDECREPSQGAQGAIHRLATLDNHGSYRSLMRKPYFIAKLAPSSPS